MAKNLVIVESPAKAKTINKFLGNDFIVRASMGHVRDLPVKKFGVDVKNDFKPDYVVVEGRKKIIQELRKAAKSVDYVYLAPDQDREGEAIAWHLKTLLKGTVPEDHFLRVTYQEITSRAIKQAFGSPSQIDEKKFNAQQARRILDRLVGYKVSPLLWRRIRGAASAGRVQSVALRLVCERENDIRKFIPEEYWILGTKVRKQVDPRDPFQLRLAKINGDKAKVTNREQAEKIRKDLKNRRLQVSAIKRREITRKPRPPYITSTLQQAGSSVFSYSPSRTMKIAQKLYEGVDLGEGPVGLITYMRTDSLNISQQAREDCRRFIEENYGGKYLPEKPNFYKSRKGAQEAHEAVRPTNVTRKPENMAPYLSPEELNVYRLIWQRFIASQMAPAKIARKTVEVDAVNGEESITYLFRATASEVIFPGYMTVSGMEKKPRNGEKGEADEDAVDKLPHLTEGEFLDLMDWLSEQKFTQPPSRYSEASLIRTMEENGVGRPSTYAQILSTLFNRQYVEKEKRSLKPTHLGLNVNEFLVANLDQLFDVTFTADMESALDEIERGNVEWIGMLGKFYVSFERWLDAAKGPRANLEEFNQLLGLLDQVQEWEAPRTMGKRAYNDEKFFKSLKKQAASGEIPISQRQAEALKRLAYKYIDQVPALAEAAEQLGLTKESVIASNGKPPKEETIKKLNLLEKVQFDAPYKTGTRTYDDKAFYLSLKNQEENGNGLSAKQINYLDKLVVKYARQIENFEKIAADLGIFLEDKTHGDELSGLLLECLSRVTQWKEPVQKGKRIWDDKNFFESLNRQFIQKRRLSEKQIHALKRLIKRYAGQIPDYDKIKDECGLS